MLRNEKKIEKQVEVNEKTAKTGRGGKVVYVRKLTSEELGEKYVTILKAEREKFPDVGSPFTIRAGEQNFRVAIKEITNSTTGPQKTKLIVSAPKLFVTQKFKHGDKIILSKKAEKIYQLRVI